jgi:hypothetical protein
MSHSYSGGPSSEASKLLEAALEQMDGIIQGARFEMPNYGSASCNFFLFNVNLNTILGQSVGFFWCNTYCNTVEATYYEHMGSDFRVKLIE